MSAAGTGFPGKNEPQPVQCARPLLPTVLVFYFFIQPKIRTVAMLLMAQKQPALSPPPLFFFLLKLEKAQCPAGVCLGIHRLRAEKGKMER